MSLFDIDTVPMACPTCGEAIAEIERLRHNGEQCAECWTNADCPSHCSDVHDDDMPMPDDFGAWTCPTYGDVWYYLGTNDERGFARLDNWQAEGHWQEPHVLVDDYWYLSMEDAGYFYCDGCGEYRPDDDYGQDCLCTSCYRNSDDYDDDDGDHDGRGGRRGTSNDVSCCASGCNSADITHYHAFTEKPYCQEHYTLMAREHRIQLPTPAMVSA